jgi:hypothetical protein
MRSQSFPLLSTYSRCRGCLFSLDHTQTHTTVDRTPLDEGSARRRDVYLTTQTLTRNKHSYLQWDSNLRSQQTLRRRPTPLGSAVDLYMSLNSFVILTTCCDLMLQFLLRTVGGSDFLQQSIVIKQTKDIYASVSNATSTLPTGSYRS